MTKKFYEANFIHGYPIVNELLYPCCPSGYDRDIVFLVYAKNEREAFNLAMDHFYDGKRECLWYGTYNGHEYNDILCIM